MTRITLATLADLNAANIAFTPTGGLSSVTVQAALAELDTEKGSGGGSATTFGPFTISASVPGVTSDQGATIQAELDALVTAGGTLLPVPGTHRISRTPDNRAHTSAAVPGGTAGQVQAALHIPRNVRLGIAPLAEVSTVTLQFDTSGWNSFAFGVHLDDTGGANILGVSNLSGVKLVTLATATWNSTANTSLSATPPSLPRAMYCQRGGIEQVYVDGAWRCSQYMVGDHFRTTDCTLYGWAAIERGPNSPTDSDDTWWRCTLQGNFCGLLVTSSSTGFTGHSFHRCHFGLKTIAVYCASAPGSGVFIQNTTFDRCSFEGGSRGPFIDPGKTTTIADITIIDPAISTLGGFDGNYAPTDVSTLPAGAMVQAGTVRRLRVVGAPFFTAPGYDPSFGCLIDAPTIQNVDMGYVGSALIYCERYGVPIVRATNVQGVEGETTDFERSNEQRVRFHLRKLTATTSRGDIVRKQVPNNSATGRRYDSTTKGLAGSALLSGANNEVVPVAHKGPWMVNTLRTGRGLNINAITTPASAVSGTGSVATGGANLGSGALIARALEDSGLTGGTATNVLKLTSASDHDPAGGEFSLNGTVYSYTNITTDGTTGIPQMNGVSPSLSAIQGGYPLAHVVKLSSSGEATSFNSTGGVALSGSTYFTFQARTGQYLIGVSNGTGTLTAGATVTEVKSFKLRGKVDDWPTTFASAVFCQGTNGGIFKYEAVLQDKILASTTNNAPVLYLADISGELNTGAFSNTTWVTGGTRVNGAIADITVVSTVTVRDSSKLPTSGQLVLNGNVVIAYTSKPSGTQVGGVSVVSGSGAISDGDTVVPKYGVRIPADSMVRPAYAAGSTDAADQGVIVPDLPRTGSKTWDPASTVDGAMTSTTLTVQGAAIGDQVAVGFSVAVPAGALLVGAVTAANTVTVTLFNKSGGTIDLASGTLKATIVETAPLGQQLGHANSADAGPVCMVDLALPA